MNRRDFMLTFGAAVAAGGMPAIPTGLTLYGDGIRDDYDALKALFLGKSVNVMPGMYHLSIDNDGRILIRNGIFNCGGRSLGDVHDVSSSIIIENCCFDVW